MPSEVKRWRCSHNGCKDDLDFKSIGRAMEHEMNCRFNPLLQSCCTCKHAFVKVSDDELDTYECLRDDAAELRMGTVLISRCCPKHECE